MTDTLATLAGRLVLRGEPGYEQARVNRIFNARRGDRQPAAVLLAESDEDVIAGVRLARERGWQITVRAGGHSWASWSLRDDALLIDLGAMRDIEYDGQSGIATARPAVQGGNQLVPFLTKRDRAFPGGHCPSVGIGGFLLQGGQGWNGRLKGWACESVVAVDVVTADGEVVHADETENSDLLWAARGAGAGFPGVVVWFYLQTYPKPVAMWHDTWTFQLDDGYELFSWLHELLPTLDRRAEPVVAATRLGDVPLYPDVGHPGGTVLLLHSTAMADSDEEAQELLAPFAHGPLRHRALGHVQAPTSLAAEGLAQAAQNPENHRYAVDCTWTDAPAEELAPLLERLYGGLDTEHSFSIWYGWAPFRPLPDMAFSVEGNIYIATYCIYTDPADDEKYRSWVHQRTGEIADQAGVGVYLGDTDFTRRQDRFLSDQHYERLLRIRESRDPDGLFSSYLTADRAGLNRHA